MPDPSTRSRRSPRPGDTTTPPPGARGRSASAQVPTDERVRSHVSGAALATVCPAARSTTMSLGSLWQSVDRHHVSLPLVIVKTCALVPTLRVQSVVPLLVSRIDSCGFCPDAYVGWSVTASTLTSRGTHGSATGVADGDGLAVAPSRRVGWRLRLVRRRRRRVSRRSRHRERRRGILRGCRVGALRLGRRAAPGLRDEEPDRRRSTRMRTRRTIRRRR